MTEIKDLSNSVDKSKTFSDALEAGISADFLGSLEKLSPEVIKKLKTTVEQLSLCKYSQGCTGNYSHVDTLLEGCARMTDLSAEQFGCFSEEQLGALSVFLAGLNCADTHSEGSAYGQVRGLSRKELDEDLQ
ncbi:hypothetical protein K9N08_03330 [Candidatus Gracilibacteria bacterium]|nr:hypothetical protein [Candidatus Gracilibacteria bacterium]MCF7856563.1 hypothetical protein [Candidatus Gracilibacteria bacterium]MCF7896889.1 hypothetical protein [Candidatus Gracilibacteria bacterium]